MKRFLIITFLFVIALFVSGFWFYQNIKPLNSSSDYKDFLITKGSGASLVAQNLQKEGLIKNALTFKIYVRAMGLSQKIQPGEYRLSPSLSLIRIVNELLNGPKEIWVTIPEGYRKEEIAEKFAKVLVKDNVFVQEFISLAKEKEGYLFPETYLFPKDISAEKIVAKMLSTFDKKVDSKIVGDITTSGKYTLDQVVTLASLVERETKTNAERPVVAGILLNRLEIGMPLQVDASVQYAIASLRCKTTIVGCTWWPQTTLEDRKIDSKMNTYKYSGLPLAPIASPGLVSIKAVVYPEGSDYFYYLHDPKGGIHYAKTLEEHNANIRKYLYK